MVNPTQADPCLLMERRACPLCLEDCSIREGSADSKDSPVGHSSKLGVEVRHPIHLGCIYKVITFRKGACTPCLSCGLEVKKEELHILKLVSVEGAADRTRIESTRVSNSLWENLEEEIASSEGRVSTRGLCAAAAAGELDLMRQYIEEGLIFNNEGPSPASIVLMVAASAGELAIVKLLLEHPASQGILREAHAASFIKALENQNKEMALILYTHIPPSRLGFSQEEHRHTIEDMMQTLEAARTGDEKAMDQELKNWARYDTARVKLTGTVLRIATQHGRSGIVNQLLTRLGSSVSPQHVEDACWTAIQMGNGSILIQLLTSRGLDLSYVARIELLSDPGIALSIAERRPLLYMNLPNEVVASEELVSALHRLRERRGLGSESLAVVIQEMQTYPTGREAFNIWMNKQVIDGLDLNNPHHYHFLNMLLSQGIVMNPKVAGGCAIAVADAPSRFADQELSSLLEKICLQTDGAIGDNDKWTILMFAVKGHRAHLVKFILEEGRLRPDLNPQQKSQTRRIPTSPEVAQLLKAAYPYPAFSIDRFGEYWNGFRGWIRSLPSKLWHLPSRLWRRFCSCFG
jgi:hypothetical protein